MEFPPMDFESIAYANSTTPAFKSSSRATLRETRDHIFYLTQDINSIKDGS